LTNDCEFIGIKDILYLQAFLEKILKDKLVNYEMIEEAMAKE
jgi:hypothetical protein